MSAERDLSGLFAIAEEQAAANATLAKAASTAVGKLDAAAAAVEKTGDTLRGLPAEVNKTLHTSVRHALGEAFERQRTEIIGDAKIKAVNASVGLAREAHAGAKAVREAAETASLAVLRARWWMFAFVALVGALGGAGAVWWLKSQPVLIYTNNLPALQVPMCQR